MSNYYTNIVEPNNITFGNVGLSANQDVSTVSPFLYLKFEDSSSLGADSSGNGNTLENTSVNFESVATYGGLTLHNTAHFSTTSYLQKTSGITSGNAIYDALAGTNFSFSGWVQFDALGLTPTTDDQIIFIFSNAFSGNPAEELELRYVGGSPGSLRFLCISGGSTVFDTSVSFSTTATWTHIAISWHINRFLFWINGIQQTMTYSVGSSSTDKPSIDIDRITIGVNYNAQFPFLGNMDSLWFGTSEFGDDTVFRLYSQNHSLNISSNLRSDVIITGTTVDNTSPPVCVLGTSRPWGFYHHSSSGAGTITGLGPLVAGSKSFAIANSTNNAFITINGNDTVGNSKFTIEDGTVDFAPGAVLDLNVSDAPLMIFTGWATFNSTNAKCIDLGSIVILYWSVEGGDTFSGPRSTYEINFDCNSLGYTNITGVQGVVYYIYSPINTVGIRQATYQTVSSTEVRVIIELDSAVSSQSEIDAGGMCTFLKDP